LINALWQNTFIAKFLFYSQLKASVFTSNLFSLWICEGAATKQYFLIFILFI
jgi:hypothetical protein